MLLQAEELVLKPWPSVLVTFVCSVVVEMWTVEDDLRMGELAASCTLWCKLSLDAAFVFPFCCFCSNQGCFMKPTGFSLPVLAPVCFLATAHYLHPVLGHLKMEAWLFWLCMWTTNCLLVLFVWVRCVLADRRKMWATDSITLRGTVDFPHFGKGVFLST